MITPVHVTVNVLVYLLIIKTGITQFHYYDLIFLFSAELIDLDHLWATPVYHNHRNPFKTHFLHKNWLLLFGLAVAFLLSRTTFFIGLALLSHFAIDYLEVKLKRL